MVHWHILRVGLSNLKCKEFINTKITEFVKLTIRVKHFGDKPDCRRFVWIFFCKFYCEFESSYDKQKKKI